MVAASKNRPTIVRLMQRIRVPLGFVTAPLLFVLAKPTRHSLLAGALIAICGVAIRGWASGHLRKNERLATGGPYALTRNPLYLGTFVMGTGISICSGSLSFIIFFEVLYLAVYIPVMIAEADTMRRLFPDDYVAYSRSVPLFLPRLTPARLEWTQPSSDSSETGFDLSLYLRHREYRAALGAIIVIALLILKSVYLK